MGLIVLFGAQHWNVLFIIRQEGAYTWVFFQSRFCRGRDEGMLPVVWWGRLQSNLYRSADMDLLRFRLHS